MSISAKDFINHKSNHHQYQCSVCMDVEPSMMRCSGPCKTPLCLRCASAICSTTAITTCPQRCSSPLHLEPIPHFQLQFQCPYSGEMCKEDIIGEEAFDAHCRECKDISPEALEQNLRRDEFVCREGHPLLFLEPKLMATLRLASRGANQQRCFGCKEKRVAIAYCPQCSSQEERVIYCHSCRKIPCTKESCPVGHELQVVEETKRTIRCDLCGFYIVLFSKLSYQDRHCNFDICHKCHTQLPETHFLIPLESNLNFHKDQAIFSQFGGFLNQEQQHHGGQEEEDSEESEPEEDNQSNPVGQYPEQNQEDDQQAEEQLDADESMEVPENEQEDEQVMGQDQIQLFPNHPNYEDDNDDWPEYGI